PSKNMVRNAVDEACGPDAGKAYVPLPGQALEHLKDEVWEAIKERKESFQSCDTEELLRDLLGHIVEAAYSTIPVEYFSGPLSHKVKKKAGKSNKECMEEDVVNNVVDLLVAAFPERDPYDRSELWAPSTDVSEPKLEKPRALTEELITQVVEEAWQWV